MPLDDGRTVDSRGEAHQSSLRSTVGSTGLNRIFRDVLGIVLRTHTADSSENRTSGHFTDRHGFNAVCEVLVLNDGKNSAYWRLSNVMVLPSQPSGLDNFEESLPRGSSKYVNGEDFDTTSQEADVNDLDGDWVVVSFIGGNVNTPYISNYWPNPRNTFDTQTMGQGNPDSEGKGTALVQTSDGRGRYFRRTNGVEQVITENGDIFVSTFYSGGDLTPNDKGETTNGRFSREIKPGPGGGIRINVKTTQPLELNWNEQEDGIGLNDTHDPALPQTNPQQTTPYYSGNRKATYIRIQNQVVSFEVPGLFSVKSQNHFKLESLADSDIIVGTRLGVTVGDVYNVDVGNDYTLTSEQGNIIGISKLGNIKFTAEEQEFLVTAKQNVDIRSLEADVLITSELQNLILTSTLATTINATTSIVLTAGTGIALASTTDIELTALTDIGLTATANINLAGATVTIGTAATEPVIKGTAYTGFEATFLAALSAYALAIGPPGPPVPLTTDVTNAAGIILIEAISVFLGATPATLTSTITVGP